MAILKANKDNAKFIGLPVEQGAAEQDWKIYQPVLKTQYANIPVDTVNSTATSLVGDFSSEAPDVFPANGDTVYIRQAADDTVFKHTVDTGVDTIVDNRWDISTASFVQSFDVSAQDSNLKGVSFKSDGSKMYMVGTGGDRVYEYNLSTAWDISTASFVQSFDVSAQEPNPQCISFKSDGSKMYVTGQSTNNVYEYNLSTAWDISTASVVQSFDVSDQYVYTKGVSFKSDGTKMYVTGQGTGNNVYEYNLSAAWDISTASVVQSFDVSAQEPTTTGVFFKSDGSKMYMVGSVGDSVYEYNLSTAWDISTASFVQSFDVSAQEPTPTGVFFKSDGSKMYVTGQGTNNVYEYNLLSSPTLDLTNDGLSAQPSHAMLAHTPVVYTSMQPSTDRCLSEDLTLYEVISSATGYSGLLPTGYEQVLADNDTVTLEVSGTPTDVIISGVTYTVDYALTGSTDPRFPDGNYTRVDFTYTAQSATPTSATIPSRAAQDTILSQLYKDDGYLETTYEEVTTTGDRALQYRVDNDESTQVKQLNYNLWKG